MIDRPLELEALDRLLRRFPVVGIIGARQVGKTTLARAFAARTGKKVVYYDLENPEDLARLTDPILVLKQHKSVVITMAKSGMPPNLRGPSVFRTIPCETTWMYYPPPWSSANCRHGTKTSASDR
jgi:hypothetical protein